MSVLYHSFLSIKNSLKQVFVKIPVRTLQFVSILTIFVCSNMSAAGERLTITE